MSIDMILTSYNNLGAVYISNLESARKEYLLR